MMAISSLVTVQAGSHYVGKLLVHCTMSSSVLPSIELIYIVHLHLPTSMAVMFLLPYYLRDFYGSAYIDLQLCVRYPKSLILLF